jgi:hypothetical protein
VVDPHHPYCEQQFPNVDPKQVVVLPQLPSLLIESVAVGLLLVVEVVDLVDDVVVGVADLVDDVVEEVVDFVDDVVVEVVDFVDEVVAEVEDLVDDVVDLVENVVDVVDDEELIDHVKTRKRYIRMIELLTIQCHKFRSQAGSPCRSAK